MSSNTITVGNNSHLVCQSCGTTVRRGNRVIAGCDCDPDSPTWCAIMADGSLLRFSQSKYEIVTNKIDPLNEQFLRGLIGDESYQIIEESDGLK